MGWLDGILGGAATGSTAGPLGAAAGAAIGLAPSIFKLFQGNSLKNQTNKINPINPGYQMNQQVIDNAKTLSDRYGNYTMPGYSAAKNNIDNNFSSAYSSGVNGASGSGDVIDLAAKLAYGKNVADNNLEAENAQGKNQALGDYLSANAAAGAEYQGKNTYDRGEYNKALIRKDAFTQAGTEDQYNALDSGASVLSAYLNPKQSVSTGGNNTDVKSLGSIYDAGQTTAPNNYNLNRYQTAAGGFNWNKMGNRY